MEEDEQVVEYKRVLVTLDCECTLALHERFTFIIKSIETFQSVVAAAEDYAAELQMPLLMKLEEPLQRDV